MGCVTPHKKQNGDDEYYSTWELYARALLFAAAPAAACYLLISFHVHGTLRFDADALLSTLALWVVATVATYWYGYWMLDDEDDDNGDDEATIDPDGPPSGQRSLTGDTRRA